MSLRCRRDAGLKAAIIERIDKKFPKMSTKFIDGPAFKALVNIRHKHEAVNKLVLNELHLLDPTYGDMSCEERAAITLSYRTIVEEMLQDGDEDLVHAHRKAHSRDKVDTQVRTEKDALGAAHDPAYDLLIKRIEGVLGEDDMRLLGLCHTFCEWSAWSKCELDIGFAFREKSVSTIAGEEARKTGNLKDLIDVKPLLRAEIGFLAHAAFLKLVYKIPRYEDVVPDSKQYLIENQLHIAFENMQSEILTPSNYGGQVEIEQIPLFPIFNSVLLILYQLYHEGRGLLIRVRRKGMTPLPGTSTKQRYLYRFAGSYWTMFKADHENGLFKVAECTDKDLDISMMLFDSFNYFMLGETGTGLSSANTADHRKALEGCNIPWLFAQYAANHPDYAPKATAKNVDYFTAYEDICMPQPAGVVEQFKPSREKFEQFHLRRNLPNEIRPNLHNLWLLSVQEGQKRFLHDSCQAISGPIGLDIYEELNRKVDFQVEHICNITVRQLMAENDAMIAKHTSAPNAEFGPFVLRLGASCFSFRNLEDAQAVSKLNKDRQRKKMCVKIHPENAIFLS